MYESSSCFIFSPVLDMLDFYFFSPSKSEIVVSYCDFNFPNDYLVILWCFYIFFCVKWLLKYFALLFILNYLFFYYWILREYLYILYKCDFQECDLQIFFFLSVTVFSLSLWCLQEKFLILIKSNLSILSFMDLCLIHDYNFFPCFP